MAEKKKNKVYGTGAFWRDKRNIDSHGQVRIIIAAPSKAAIGRLLPELARCAWTETYNDTELGLANAKPMTFFARALCVFSEAYIELTDADYAKVRR